MAVLSLMALAISSGEFARTSFAPVSRMALSKALRPPAMTTSCFIPVVSGSCQISLSSVPAMQAAVAAAMAPAEPEVTIPDSAPVSSDKRAADSTLKFEHVHEIFAGFQLGLANFGKLQRAAEIGPRAAAIDDRLHPKPGIDVLLSHPFPSPYWRARRDRGLQFDSATEPQPTI